jgi:hypothetical protein
VPSIANTAAQPYAPTPAQDAVSVFDCASYAGALLRVDGSDLTRLNEDGSADVVWALPGDDMNGVALHADDETRAFAAFEDVLCEFDQDDTKCFAETLKFAPDFGGFIEWRYYYGVDVGTAEGRIAFVGDVDDEAPEFEASVSFPMDPLLFQGTLLDVVALKEGGEGEFVVGEEGEYLVGLSDDLKVVVIRLDDGPDTYAALEPQIEWSGERETAGPFSSLVFDGEALYAISDSGVGMFKIELPLVVGDWCWDPESVDEDNLNDAGVGYSEGVCYLNEEG